MTNDLEKVQMCLYLRNGVEIWLDEEKAKSIANDIATANSDMGLIEGRLINFKDVVGIFKPVDLEELHRRNRGEWLCKYGSWHTRKDTCYCVELRRKAESDKIKFEYEIKAREEANNIIREPVDLHKIKQEIREKLTSITKG